MSAHRGSGVTRAAQDRTQDLGGNVGTSPYDVLDDLTDHALAGLGRHSDEALKQAAETADRATDPSWLALMIREYLTVWRSA